MTFFPSLRERLRPSESPCKPADIPDRQYQDLDNLCNLSASRRLPNHIAFSPGGFFTGAARVHMGDGSNKAISDVVVGERVMNRQGPDLVVEKLRTRLGKALLFSLNGGEAFATADHAFFTLSGWRRLSTDPVTHGSDREGAQRLRVGDFVGVPRTGLISPCAPAGPDGFALDYIFLNAITPSDSDPDTEVFGLRLGRGRTCFVNDFLVLGLNGLGGQGFAPDRQVLSA